MVSVPVLLRNIVLAYSILHRDVEVIAAKEVFTTLALGTKVAKRIILSASADNVNAEVPGSDACCHIRLTSVGTLVSGNLGKYVFIVSYGVTKRCPMLRAQHPTYVVWNPFMLLFVSPIKPRQFNQFVYLEIATFAFSSDIINIWTIIFLNT